MREIKFRIPMFTDKGTFTEFQYLKLGDDIGGTLCGHNGEPQQYTGLKDKNGKEIYEGDVVREGNVGNYEILYDAPRFTKKCNSGIYALQNEQYLEIIGNIYENTELLQNQ